MEQRVDEIKYRASLARLESIFRDMSNTASEVSTWRCPYKNAKDRCTAPFRFAATRIVRFRKASCLSA